MNDPLDQAAVSALIDRFATPNTGQALDLLSASSDIDFPEAGPQPGSATFDRAFFD
jgi:hypothetical protein